jgi:hypothetical protein
LRPCKGICMKNLPHFGETLFKFLWNLKGNAEGSQEIFIKINKSSQKKNFTYERKSPRK